MSTDTTSSEAEQLAGPDAPVVTRMEDLVGNTPLVRLNHVVSGPGAPIYVKLENENPSGSMRDRYVGEIVERALLAGQLRVGDTIALAGIDDSAVAAAFVASALELNARIFAPKSSSRRLVPLIERYGASIEWLDDDGLDASITAAANWARPAFDRMYVDGYRRQAVGEAYRAIANEIITGLADIPLGGFVTSVTTGGTYRAVAAELVPQFPNLMVGGIHIVENEFAHADLPAGVASIPLDQVWAVRDRVARDEGLLLGPKGAACIKAALDMRDRVPPDQAIVALNPDAGHRYLGWEDKPLFKTTLGERDGV